MRDWRKSLGILAVLGLVLSACNIGAPAQKTVSLQLQWAPQAQFAGYFAADREGYYAAEGLKVNMVSGGPNVLPHVVGSDPAGPEFTISWVPKVLEIRAKGQSDLVDIAQIFQRSGTRSVSWAAGKGPAPQGTENITSPEQYAGKNIGVWDFGNEYEVTAAGLKTTSSRTWTTRRLIQPFDMDLLLNREIDVAEAMIYNEYAQVLEANEPCHRAAVSADRPQRHQLQRRRHGDAPGRDLRPPGLAGPSR